jgi:GGDEF domain-containing protein/PAS domain-containing protein
VVSARGFAHHQLGGNPNTHGTADPLTGQLSPRNSFAAWKETVSGHSVPWAEIDIAIARELRRSFEAEVAQRSELIQLRSMHEEKQRLQSARLKAALENLGDGVAMFDARSRLVVCNHLYGSLYSLPNDMQEAGTRYQDIVGFRVRNRIVAGETSDLAVKSKLDELGKLPHDRPSSRVVELSDGRLISVTRQPLEDDGWVGTHEDVTERHRRDAKIAFLAHHDLLTGLANRAVFAESLDGAVARLRRHGECFTVMILDLDRFKSVNDNFGHPAGDLLLKETADRPKSALRETDVVARLGGDEFAIIQSGGQNQIQGAEGLAERLVKLIACPYDLDGKIAFVGGQHRHCACSR